MQLKQIPLDQLKVSKLNMRHGRKTPDISDILPSIRERGVRQSLLVRKEGKGYGVVAGRRRYFALKAVAKETGKPVKVPCGILEANDDAKAIEDSILENIARMPADEFQQYDAFARLAAAGKSTAAIAESFGITELKVKRILALAHLLPEVKALFEDDKIRVPTLRALTLATPEQQSKWLELFHDENEYEPHGDRLKAWLTGGENIATETALFDISGYSGVIISDLFGDSAIFQDPDMFWLAQNASIAARVDEYREDGWQDIVIMERGQPFSSWAYGKRERESGGKIFVETRHDGQVNFHEGYLSNDDIKKIDAILNGPPEDNVQSKASKPEMSGPLSEYVALHRHGAIRASLLVHPSVALRLTAAHMLLGSDLWSVAPQPTKSRKDSTTQSVAGSESAAIFEAERTVVYELVGVSQSHNPYSPNKTLADGDLTTLFSRLLELDDNAVMRVMTFAMCESLKAGSEIIEAITYAVPVDMAALWEPDDAFFDILRDKAVINAMVEEIAGKNCADGAITDTGKSQKQIIRNRMAGHGTKQARPDWRPRWMQVPPAAYLDKTTCPPAAADAAVRKIMTKAEKRPKAA